MEDLYKDDPNSWLRRAYFSNTVYHRPDPSQLPVSSIEELKLWHSDLNSKWPTTSMRVTKNNASKTSAQFTTMLTLKSNPDSSLTSEVPEDYASNASKTGPASKKKSLSGILKAVKDTVRSKFVGPPSRERTGTKAVKSSSGTKKYFDHGVHNVIARQKYSEVY